jgi:hypothetical protein
MNLRGEGLAPGKIGALILILVGAVILILAYTQINWSGQIDDKVCHESVLFRGTLMNTAGLKDYVQLKCQTKKICVGKECEEFANTKGITRAKIDTQRDLNQLFAQEAFRCWEMMGEGKLSLFSQWGASYGIGDVYPTCVICSRIAFDEKYLDDKDIKIEELDTLSYMISHKVPGKDISYYEYLGGGQTQFRDTVNFPNEGVDSDSVTENSDDESIEISSDKVTKLESILQCNDGIDNDGDGKIDLMDSGCISKDDFYEGSNEIAVIFTQISAPTWGDANLKVLRTLSLGAGGSFLASPSLTTHAATLVGKSCAASAYSAVACAAVVGIGELFLSVNIIKNRGIAAGNCGDLSVGGEERKGCSVVRTLNYDSDSITKYCAVIESIT